MASHFQGVLAKWGLVTIVHPKDRMNTKMARNRKNTPVSIPMLLKKYQ
jgi:hypothetical protein